MSVDVGQVAPDFTLVDENRKPHRLGDYRGKNVLLAFYPGAFTGGCTQEVCSLRDTMQRLNDLNVQVLGISVDPPFSLKVWGEQNHLNFPLLSDFNRQVVNAYGVPLPNMGGIEGYTAARRSVFLIDKDGIVRYKWLAPPGQPIPNYDEIARVVNELGG